MITTTEFSWQKEIRKARKDRGITQQQLTELTGIHQSRISQIETGHGEAKMSEVVAISEAVGMTLVMVPERSLADVEEVIHEHERLDPANRERTIPELILGDRAYT